MKAVSAMKKLWWGANIYWVILLIYGGIKLFTYNFDTSELGETASLCLNYHGTYFCQCINY